MYIYLYMYMYTDFFPYVMRVLLTSGAATLTVVRCTVSVARERVCVVLCCHDANTTTTTYVSHAVAVARH